MKKRRNKSYELLEKKLRQIAASGKEGSTFWEIPKSLSTEKARMRIHSFLVSKSAPRPHRKFSWHTTLETYESGKRDVVIFTGVKHPSRKKKTARRAASKKAVRKTAKK